MRYIRYLFLLILTVILLVLALANMQAVTIRLLPETMAGFMGWSWSQSLPLFVVILGGVLAGILVGFVAEWLREHKHRAEARHQRREKEALQREVAKRQSRQAGKGDEVLALLEDGSAPR